MIILKKISHIISVLLIFVIIFNPALIYAQEVPTDSGGNRLVPVGPTDATGNSYYYLDQKTNFLIQIDSKDFEENRTGCGTVGVKGVVGPPGPTNQSHDSKENPLLRRMALNQKDERTLDFGEAVV